jgi:CDP-4-dehydro-6-deoxyglucose reductase
MLINTNNKSITADPSISILDSALSSGIVFDYSCKNGQCGACKTTLLEGKVVELQAQIALSEMDRKNNKILSCCCAPATDILIDAEDLTALKDIEIKTSPARINKIDKKTDEIIEVELRLPPAADMRFLEGQYIDVIGPDSLRRSYSIANSMGDKTITLWIKKVENGKFSQFWFNQAKKNDLLRIEGPKGTFFFRGGEKKIILLATGTGIAPIKSILDKLDESMTEVSFHLYWGNRRPEDFFWEPNYKNVNLKYTPVLSKENAGWAGKTGYVQDIIIKQHHNLENTEVYACGSIDMIESARALFIKNGLEEQHFHSDAFVSS